MDPVIRHPTFSVAFVHPSAWFNISEVKVDEDSVERIQSSGFSPVGIVCAP